VTVLFADVTGSTALGERLDPERLREVLTAFFQAMREEIEAEGGTVEKFIGDAVMAAFGVPIAHEDDPSRALRAALRMQRRLEQVNEDLSSRHDVTLQIRIGVNTGEVLAAIEAQPGEPMVTGDAVNVAARLEHSAQPGTIVVAERTARAARGFRFHEPATHDVRGRDQPVRAVVLEAAAPERSERGVPGLQAPMVGRDNELALMRTFFDRSATESTPNLVTIYGDPGVGKSRLTAEFVTEIERHTPSPNVVRGRCLPYGDGITYWPLAEILKRLAGVSASDPPDRTIALIRTLGGELLTADVAADPRTAIAALAYTMGLDDPDVPLGTMEPRDVRTRIHSAWRSLFSALAKRSPIVVVIEDVHWAGTALLDLLEELADRVVGPVLFMCPARPEFTNRRPGWGGGKRNVSSISLEPLSPDDADRLVAFLLEVEDLPQTVHARILERAEGNPFFVEEIVRQLIDEGRIVRRDDRWLAAADIADVDIPDTVQGVLAARIDLLAAAEKRTLQRAAVVGRVFWPEPVGLLLNGDRDKLNETLDRLEERELVRSQLTSTIAGEPEFIFKHVLTRDVAYESLPRRERGHAHAAVAEWIEMTSGERRAEFAELLAHHYDEAYRAERAGGGGPEHVERLRVRAFEAIVEAADITRRRFAIEAALRLSERAVAIAVTPLERARSLEQRGLTARNDYRGDLSWQSFREAADIRLAELPEDGLAIARACAQGVENPLRWPGSMAIVPPEEDVRRYIDVGLERAPEGTIERIRLMTGVAFMPFAFASRRGFTRDEVDECLRSGVEAADIALAADRPDLASAALDGASSALVVIGEYGRGEPVIERRLQLLDRIDDPWETGDIHDMASWHALAIGNYARAKEHADHAFSLIETGIEGLAIHGLSWGALAELQLGNWSQVLDVIAPTVERLLGPRIDHPPYFSQNMFGAAAVIAAARTAPSAERYEVILRTMASDAVATDFGHGGIRALLGWVLLVRGALDESRAQLDESNAIPFLGHAPILRQVEADHIAAAERWNDVPSFVENARRYASRAGLWALPLHLDRLEGRAALAAGDARRAIEWLERARDGFAALAARWEGARTDAFLAEALAIAGSDDHARARLKLATEVFEELGAVGELRRAAELAKRMS
jgi:class 3 adenylate cyclase